MRTLVERVEGLDRVYSEDGTRWCFTDNAKEALKEMLETACETDKVSLAKELGIHSCVGDPIPYRSPKRWEYAVVDNLGDLRLVGAEPHLWENDSPVQQANILHTTYHPITLELKSLKDEFESSVIKMKKKFWEEADIPYALHLGMFGGPHPTFTRMVGVCPVCGEDLVISSVDTAVNVLCLKTIPLAHLHNLGVSCTPPAPKKKQTKEKPATKVVKTLPEEKTELYIQNLSAPFFSCLKVGIAKSTNKRMKQQQRLGMFKHNISCVFEFDTREQASDVEREIKSTFRRSICLPEWLPDGWTETFVTEDYQAIVGICVDRKGVLKEEKE